VLHFIEIDMSLRPKSEWLRGLLDFVFPPLCLGCGKYTEDEYAVCGTCRETIDDFHHPFCLNCLSEIPAGRPCGACGEECVPLYAYGDYAKPLEQIVIQFKFRGITRISEMLARLIADRFGHLIEARDADWLVPIPLHSNRETHRGYNQAEVLAGELSKCLGIGVDASKLERVKKRRPQARLSQAERLRNIRDVFSLRDNFGDNLRLILVDDVVTSGATVKEAARVISRNGAEVVGVISIAHAK
jgi:ComF family protein